jgi:hypothetical protein
MGLSANGIGLHSRAGSAPLAGTLYFEVTFVAYCN